MAVNSCQKLVIQKMEMKFLGNLLKFTGELMMGTLEFLKSNQKKCCKHPNIKQLKEMLKNDKQQTQHAIDKSIER